MSKVELKKREIIQRITQHMVVNGLGDMGLRTLAAVGGTSDRMLIYYFGTKDQLVEVAMNAIASSLSAQLDAVLGTHQRDLDLLEEELFALRRVLEFRLVIQLWFEVVGLAVRGREPYASTAIQIAENWVGWMESRVVPEDLGRVKRSFAHLEGRFMIDLIGVD